MDCTGCKHRTVITEVLVSTNTDSNGNLIDETKKQCKPMQWCEKDLVYMRTDNFEICPIPSKRELTI
jgi:hypothetical protein